VIGEGAFGRWLIPRRLFENESFFRIDECQINIRTVVQLLPAELSEPKHRELRGKPRPARALMVRLSEPLDLLCLANSQHRAEADICEIGKFKNDFGRAPQMCEITRSHTHQLALME